MTLSHSRSVVPRLTLLVACAALAAAGCRKSAPPPPPAAATETPVQQAPTETIRSLADIASEYESLQQQADQNSQKIAATLSTYQKRGGKLPPNFGPDLTDEQRQVLVDRIQQERSGTKALLQDIVDRDKQIQALRAKMKEMGPKLPDHVTAGEGDTHDKIAMKYLISKGVSAQKAFDMLSDLNLAGDLVPGFTVWTYLMDGQFGTWVTRGSAAISPQEHQKRLAKLIDDERNELKNELATLNQSQEQLRAAAKSASEESGALMALLEKSEAAKNAALNTIRYSLGAKSQLQKMKVIDGRLKLMSLDNADMFSLNSADNHTIAVDGSNFGLKKIKKITLVPEIFVPGTDFELQQDGAFANIKIVNLDKFRKNQFVIVVE
jgi:hypothetical protein